MDPTEDLSARVLLRRVLMTETPRTPLSRSAPQAPSGSGLQRSSRFSREDAEPQTPQTILRRSLRHNVQASITRKIPPATKRRTASAVLRKQAASSSMVFNDEETPRHLLRNILQTEPLKSPVIHEKVPPAELPSTSAHNPVNATLSSIDLSGHDLSDVTTGNVVSTKRGLSRKRPRQSLNVTAFEKRLKEGEDAEEKSEKSIGDLSSLSLSSSTSLSLKTPFVDVRTEKRGLQRRVSRRRKITEEEFNAALNKQQMGDVSGRGIQERNLGEDTNFEGISLGLSKVGEPDITVDIMNCRTALYDQEDAMASNFSISATQDKSTVIASQLQRDMQEEQRKKSVDVLCSEDDAVTDPEKDEGVSDSRGKKDVDKTEPEDTEADDQPDDGQDSAASSGSEEKEDAVGSQTSGLVVRVECEEPEAQTEEEAAADSQPEDVGAGSQSEQDGPQDEDEGMDQSETEEEATASQSDEEKAAASSQTEDEGGLESQAEEVAANKSQCDVEEQSQAEEDTAVRQTDEDHNEDETDQEEEWGSELLERDVGHISRRAYRSEGGLLLPVIKARENPTDASAAGLSKGHNALDLNTSLEIRSQSQTGKPEWPKPPLQDDEDDPWSENDVTGRKNASFNLLQVSHELEVCGQQSDISPEEAPAEDAAEQEEEWDEEDSDSEEFPSKMPAFVREKRKFTYDPPALPSVVKKVQASGSSTGEALPTAKPKQVRLRKPGPSRKKPILPKSYLMGAFRHFAKTKVSPDVFPVLNEIMDKFFTRVAEDLETYAAHAKRKTIQVEDVILLLRRQGYVNDEVPVEVLIEKYLPLEQRRMLIPCATSGNVVIPKIRK